jgi:chitin disaccharide deacetylase
MKIRINADDFGISPGVNLAIEEMFRQKKLHSASLIYGCGYFEKAIEIAKQNPNLKVGLHFNLSSGKSAFSHQNQSLLVDKEGNFKNGFLKLLLLSFFQKEKLQQEIKQELEAQIEAIKSCKIKLNHIDSHRHIHFIPAIFPLVVAAAQKHQVQQVRVINESLFATWQIDYPKNFLWNGGLVKWLILRSLGLFNGSKKIPQSYFFSILHTCKISRNLIDKIKVPKNFDEVEIMIHPGNPQIDISLENLQERAHLISGERLVERL